MARDELRYVELKTGNDDGPAWIARVRLSNSGRTVYFNGKALKRASGGMVAGNHYDLETHDEYWVSGVKKDGNDRHWAGSGKVMIDARVVDEYLALVGKTTLDDGLFEVVTNIVDPDPARFHELENRSH